jgi:acetoacetate decarboxylase
MNKEDVLKQYTTPIAAPAFVQGPHRFKRREYLNITYRTDRGALSKMVPESLEIDQPLVRFEVMKMPDTTGYGAYVECGQAAVVRMGQEHGEFLLGMYLDNLPAIAAGRELRDGRENRQGNRYRSRTCSQSGGGSSSAR